MEQSKSSFLNYRSFQSYKSKHALVPDPRMKFYHALIYRTNVQSSSVMKARIGAL